MPNFIQILYASRKAHVSAKMAASLKQETAFSTNPHFQLQTRRAFLIAHIRAQALADLMLEGSTPPPLACPAPVQENDLCDGITGYRLV